MDQGQTKCALFRTLIRVFGSADFWPRPLHLENALRGSQFPPKKRRARLAREIPAPLLKVGGVASSRQPNAQATRKIQVGRGAAARGFGINVANREHFVCPPSISEGGRSVRIFFRNFEKVADLEVLDSSPFENGAFC